MDKIIAVDSTVTAFFVSYLYKTLSGRTSPPFHELSINISNQFHFGFMQGEMIGGWPSSHTAIAFAIAFSFLVITPKWRKTSLLAGAFAIFVGFSESIGFHWLSEVISGAIIGSMIGYVVGKSFLTK